VWNKVFVYRNHDQKVLWLTRRLAALNVDRGVYRQLFEKYPEDDFAAEIAAFADAGLVTKSDDAIRPTPKGMFYADSVAALLATRAIRANRDLGPAVVGRDAPDTLLTDTRENQSRSFHMG
jgi:oxygen-independent coproporphyrinogen-3 oxidase